MYKKIYTQYKYILWSVLRVYWFLKKLSSKKQATKTTVDSYDIYQNYNDREQISYDMESSLMLYNGILENISWKKARNLYLANIFFEIDDLLKLNDKVSILEVGAGNCINLHILKLKYGEKIEITGLDISEKRISVAKKYFKNTLNNIQFIVSSITQKTPFDSNSFDIVFSMHCLEQIAYDSKVAIQEMYRITNNKLLMIEPIFENGNFLQKIYLIDADHNRILLKNILELELPLKVNSTINIQSSAWNQSSFIKIEKE